MKIEDSIDTAKPTIQIRSFKGCTLLLKNMDFFTIHDFGDDDRLLLNNLQYNKKKSSFILIIASWQVVSEIPNPDELEILFPFIKVPFYDFEKFPYVIFKSGQIYLMNL